MLGGNGTYARIDPGPGEHLNEFDVYEVIELTRTGKVETFRPALRPLRIRNEYS